MTFTLREWARQHDPRETPAERRQRGRAAQRTGAALEVEALAALRAAGCWAAKVPTPAQILRAEGRTVTARLEAPTAPDVLGVTPAGQGLALEVKASDLDAPSWPLPARLQGHQGAALRDVHANGGAAAVLLRWGAELYLIPWALIDLGARKSLPREVARRWLVGPGWAAHLATPERWRGWCASRGGE